MYVTMYKPFNIVCVPHWSRVEEDCTVVSAAQPLPFLPPVCTLHTPSKSPRKTIPIMRTGQHYTQNEKCSCYFWYSHHTGTRCSFLLITQHWIVKHHYEPCGYRMGLPLVVKAMGYAEARSISLVPPQLPHEHHISHTCWLCLTQRHLVWCHSVLLHTERASVSRILDTGRLICDESIIKHQFIPSECIGRQEYT